MKRWISLALAVILLLALCACSLSKPEPTPTPTPTPEPTPTPLPTELDPWFKRAQTRYNMEYESFAEYWDLMCDEFYGDSVKTVLAAISFEDKDKEVADKRAEFDSKYGSDWKYAITDCKKEDLGEKACKDFAEELEDISERAAIVVNASGGWGERQWRNFAEAHGGTVDEAKAVVEAFRAISEACHEAKVTKALELTLTLEFTGSKTKTAETSEVNAVYEVNGVYVSEMLLDYSYALLNLVC